MNGYGSGWKSGARATGLAVDSQDNLIASGEFSGTMNLGGATHAADGPYQVFLGKFTSAGTLLWSTAFDGSGSDYQSSVAVDGAGNIVIAAATDGSIDFGGGALTSAGSEDIVLAKLTGSGAHVWSRRFGDLNYQSRPVVAATTSGDTVLGCVFDGTLDFGNGGLASFGADVAIARFAP